MLEHTVMPTMSECECSRYICRYIHHSDIHHNDIVNVCCVSKFTFVGTYSFQDINNFRQNLSISTNNNLNAPNF